MAAANPGRFGWPDAWGLRTRRWTWLGEKVSGTFSRYLFPSYLNDPVEMLHPFPNGSGRVVRLGPDVRGGMRPQVIVPQGVWQGSRLVPGGRFAFLGTTVAPGFDFADYEHGARAGLLGSHPTFRDLILSLTSADA